MKKILLCLFALLLLCGCAEKQAQIPEHAQFGSIHSVTPSYETRYFARRMDIWKDEETIAPFQAAYEQVLPTLTETNETIPEGDQYFFYVFHKRNDENQRLYLRLVDDGKGCWLELKPKTRNPDWMLTYALSRDAAQPLLAFFEDEPTGKPHIEGHPNGRVVPFLERIEKGWPIFEGKVLSVSDQVKEFSLHEELRYGWLYREFTVEVAKCYNGDLNEGDKLTYRVFGGETDDYSFSVENAPQVQVGDYVVIAAPEHSFATAYNVFPATVLNEYYATFTPPVGLMQERFGNVLKTYDTNFLNALSNGWVTTDQAAYNASRENLPDRISDRELAELRLQYTRKGSIDPLSQRIRLDGWEDIQFGYDGLVVLDFIGQAFFMSPGPNHTIYEGPATMFYTNTRACFFFFARVEEILIGCEELQVGDLIPIPMDVTVVGANLDFDRALYEGQRFACVVTKSTDENTSYYLPGSYGATKLLHFYLTEDDVVLYAGEEFDDFLDNCSGMYLPAFTELIREKLFSGE